MVNTIILRLTFNPRNCHLLQSVTLIFCWFRITRFNRTNHNKIRLTRESHVKPAWPVLLVPCKYKPNWTCLTATLFVFHWFTASLLFFCLYIWDITRVVGRLSSTFRPYTSLFTTQEIFNIFHLLTVYCTSLPIHVSLIRLSQTLIHLN